MSGVKYVWWREALGGMAHGLLFAAAILAVGGTGFALGRVIGHAEACPLPAPPAKESE